MNAGTGKVILLPVETIVREFDGKSLLALIARKKGWQVFIGDQTAIRKRLWNLPEGTYLSTSARSGNTHFFKLLHSAGHRIAVLDEEVLVRQGDDIYMMKHERNALKHVQLLMTWGRESYELWRDFNKIEQNKITTIGNP